MADQQQQHHQDSTFVKRRRVTWVDDYGKDIAHVHEFEPSEDGELEGVKNSCVCVIQ